MPHQYPNAAFVDNIRKFILDHIRDIGLDRLSEEYGYSKAYLSDMVSRTTGMKFTEHVRLVRITYAKDLLERTQLPIDQIAYQAGFSNQSWFYQVFKQETGLTPGDYREMTSCD